MPTIETGRIILVLHDDHPAQKTKVGDFIFENLTLMDILISFFVSTSLLIFKYFIRAS